MKKVKAPVIIAITFLIAFLGISGGLSFTLTEELMVSYDNTKNQRFIKGHIDDEWGYSYFRIFEKRLDDKVIIPLLLNREKLSDTITYDISLTGQFDSLVYLNGRLVSAGNVIDSFSIRDISKYSHPVGEPEKRFINIGNKILPIDLRKSSKITSVINYSIIKNNKVIVNTDMITVQAKRRVSLWNDFLRELHAFLRW